MKVIARRPQEDTYLLDLEMDGENGVPQGQIVDVERGKVFPRMGIPSLLARAPWLEFADGALETPDAEAILLAADFNAARQKARQR